MNRWMWAVSLVGILSTAVVWGTDMFFLTIGRSALRLATFLSERPAIHELSGRSAAPQAESASASESPLLVAGERSLL
jgi:hypothetical protein